MSEMNEDNSNFIPFDRSELETGYLEKFGETVESFSQKIAIKDDRHEFTYMQVNNVANQAALEIQKSVNKEQQPIGLLIGHNCSMAFAMLAVLKSHNYFIVMDPVLSVEHLAFMVEDTGVQLIITDSDHSTLADNLAQPKYIPFFSIDQFNPNLNASNVVPHTSQGDLFQILFTSGSTGRPKGVIYSNRMLARSISNKINSHQLNSSSRSSLITLFSFGGAFTTLLGSLLRGGTAFLYDFRKKGLLDIKDWIKNEKITHFQATGTIFRQFVETLSEEDFFPSIKLFSIGGEKIYPNDLPTIKKHLNSDCVFGFGLASSETHSIAYMRIPANELPEWDHVPVGYPSNDLVVHLWDENGTPVPVGSTGEIVVEGDALALGYLNHPELTTQKFLPSKSNPKNRLYKMGDLGQMLPNGMLLHMGRIDRQLKIRGVRIEPEGIENILLSFPQVKDVVVTNWTNPSGETKLIAYLKTGEREKGYETLLRNYASKELAATMLPSYYVFVDEFARTPNGKLDRSKLPEPNLSRPDLKNEYIAPESEIETKLVNVWEQTLGIAGIGIEDKFFELGGDSLTAASLFVEIENVFQLKLPLSILMKAETIRQQALILETMDYEANWSPVVPIQPEGPGIPIFCIAGKGGNPLRFRMLSELIGTKNPVYFMQSRGLDGKIRPYHQISDIAADYIDEIKKIIPSGPYHLIGSSFGGLVAYEIATRLPAEEVGVIAMLDTFGPDHMLSKRRRSSSFSKFNRYIKKHLRLIFQTGKQARQEYFRYYRDFLPIAFKKLTYQIKTFFTNNKTTGLPQEFVQVERANLSAARRYQAPAFAGEVILLRAKHQPKQKQDDPTLGWGNTNMGNLLIHEVNSHHGDILFHPAIQEVYDFLKPRL